MSQTVYQAFCRTAGEWPQRPFICVLPETAHVYDVPAGEISYASASERVESLREAYQAAGYGHGHRVGLLLENRPAFFYHWFALNALGVSVVPINPDMRAAELEYLIGHSEMILAVALSPRHADLLEAARRTARPFQVMSPEDCPPSAVLPPPQAEIAPHVLSESALLYTSGTTGRPKGCILQNRYFLHAGKWYAGIDGLPRLNLDGERMLTPLPLVHMNAMAYSTMAMITVGGCLILLDRFHPGTWWDSVRESRATVVHYLGVMPAMLMKAAPDLKDREHHVRFGFGAGVDRTLHALFEERFGIPLLEAWAMTETGAGAVIIANREPRQIGTSCFGQEGADVQVRIVDDTGADSPVGTPGELLVRHAGQDVRYGFFAGYLKDPEATDDVWAGEWFHTGDIVQRDATGQLHFIDRKKNVIRRSGENIAAVEVESVLQHHPQVKSVAVAAVPDPVRGDEVMALVIPHTPLADRQAMEQAAAELVTWSLSQLAYYKAPGYVVFVDSLPLTVTNKIQRGELKALAPALLEQAACINTCRMKKRQDPSAARQTSGTAHPSPHTQAAAGQGGAE